MKAATLAESVSINAEGRVLCLLSTHGAYWHHVNGAGRLPVDAEVPEVEKKRRRRHLLPVNHTQESSTHKGRHTVWL